MSTLPTFFFSLRSPYSWLAWHDLKTRYPKLLARLQLQPFWEPDAGLQQALGAAGETFLYTAMSREKHLYILGDVKRLAQQRGLQLRWPVDVAPHWEVPHLAWYIADEAGLGREYIERITALRWQHGRNICDPATVAELGQTLGLDGAALAEAHRDERLRTQGLQALRACIDGGVFGVPFFRSGRDRFWGLDRLPAFIGAVAEAAPGMEAVTAAPGLPNRAIEDHAGGCG